MPLKQLGRGVLPLSSEGLTIFNQSHLSVLQDELHDDSKRMFSTDECRCSWKLTQIRIRMRGLLHSQGVNTPAFDFHIRNRDKSNQPEALQGLVEQAKTLQLLCVHGCTSTETRSLRVTVLVHLARPRQYRRYLKLTSSKGHLRRKAKGSRTAYLSHQNLPRRSSSQVSNF